MHRLANDIGSTKLTSNMSGAPGVLVEQRPGDERLPARVAVEPLPRVDALVHLQRALLAERLAAVWGRFGVAIFWKVCVLFC